MSSAPNCPACGAANPADAKFCGSCGAAVNATCPRCGHRNPSDGSFCLECGAALATSALDATLSNRQAYTPPSLATKIRAGTPGLEGERKQITVLFADVAGYTSLSERLDPEETRALMQRAFALMLEEIHRYEGTVSQFLGDGMLALFGAPIAHEDHAQRAIRAGLGIQHALAGYRSELAKRGIDFRIRVGLNSGPVVFGHVGTDLEFTLQAVGDTVNTASRVQGLASPGAVVASESTWRLAEGYFVFRDLGSFEVKGKADPLRVFEVERPSRSRSRVDVGIERGLSPFLGRDEEMRILTSAFEDARTGRGRLVLISGEAGLGKSRLLYELRTQLEAHDVMWLTGRCISYGADIPYVPVIDLIKDASGIEEADDEAAMLAKLDAAVEAVKGDPASLPYLRYLLSIDPGDPAIAEQEPTLRKARVFESFRDVLTSAASQRPVVLVIEDTHWIDPLSTELLSFVADTLPDHGVLLLLTHRPDWESPFGERPYYASVRLQILSESDTISLAEAATGGAELPESLRATISLKTEGNPFFIEEVTRALIEGGGTPVAEGIPNTIQDVIMARLDRLQDEARGALQTASVIGREFTVRLLDRTAGLGVRAEPSLRQLKAAQLIFERTLYPELVFMFKHALTHDVAYESMLKERRRVLHGDVGDAIEELYPDRLPELYEILVHHFELAERWDKAVEYLSLAATKSLAADAVPRAVSYCERALEIGERSPSALSPTARIVLHRTLGQACGLMNDFPRAIENYRVVTDMAAGSGDVAVQGEALSDLTYMLILAHRFDEASDAARQGASLDEQAQAAAVINLAFIDVAEGHIDRVHRMLAEIEAAIEGASPTFQAMGLGVVDEVYHWMGDEAKAIELSERGSSVANALQIKEAMLWIDWDHALMVAAIGRYEEALRLFAEHLELCRRIQDAGFWTARSLNARGWTHMQLADWEQGERWNRTALEAAIPIGDPEIVRNAQLNLADCALARGDVGEAIRVLDEVESACAADSTRGDEWMKWRYIQHLWASSSDAHLAAGDPDAALRYADRCVERAEATSSPRYIARGRETRARALVALGRVEEAVVDVEQAMEGADAVGTPSLRWRTALAVGDVRAAAGRTDAAAAYEVGIAIVEETAGGLEDANLRDTLLASEEVARLRAGAA